MRQIELLGIVGIVMLATSATPTNAQHVTNMPSGQQLFQDHCATCHGTDGTGHGPMAEILKVPPADLTQIGARAGGAFPAARVAEIIRYGGDIAGHGTAAMPVWGMVFSGEGGGGKVGGAYSRRAVIELKDYLETMQKKAP